MKSFRRNVSILLLIVFVVTACSAPAPQPTEVAPPPTPAAPEATATATMFTPGEYEGVGQGNNGEIHVLVSVDADKILSVDILEQKESEGIADLVWERIPADVVKHQTIGVDVISGATNSTNGLLAAIEAALVKAGGDMTVLAKAVEKDASGVAVEKEADIIVVGAGGAGLAAAASAKQNGASVIVIEKMSKPGGNTIISGAAYNSSDKERQSVLDPSAGPSATVENLINAEPESDLHKELQAKLKEEYDAYIADGSKGLFDSPTMHALQTFEGGDRVGYLENAVNFTNNTLPTLEWLEDIGMEFTDEIFTVLGALWPRSHKPVKPLGTGYIETLVAFADKNDIEIMCDTKAAKLLTDNGRVVGVHAFDKDGNDVTLTAKKGVIMATGGFGKNVEMRMQYDTAWGTLDETIKSTNHSGATGDGIIMAQEIGAQLTGMEYVQLLPMGDPETGSLSGNIEQSVEDRIFINKEGNRFVAEDARRDVMTKALFEQTDAYMYVIVDSQCYPEPETTKNNFNETINELVEAGRAFKGDTLEELAAEIGVDPANLVASVESFNEAVDARTDEFGRTLFNRKINQAPFYAGPRVPTVHHTMGGLRVTVDGQVLDEQDQIIEGFYAAGEVAGGIHGSNRLGGNALSDAHTNGRLVGAFAAKN